MQIKCYFYDGRGSLTHSQQILWYFNRLYWICGRQWWLSTTHHSNRKCGSVIRRPDASQCHLCFATSACVSSSIHNPIHMCCTTSALGIHVTWHFLHSITFNLLSIQKQNYKIYVHYLILQVFCLLLFYICTPFHSSIVTSTFCSFLFLLFTVSLRSSFEWLQMAFPPKQFLFFYFLFHIYRGEQQQQCAIHVCLCRAEAPSPATELITSTHTKRRRDENGFFTFEKCILLPFFLL